MRKGGADDGPRDGRKGGRFLSGAARRRRSMTFASILFRKGAAVETAAEPEFFVDLNLDQVVGAITAGREEYDLVGFFHMPLYEHDDIIYRQEIMRDLEDAGRRAQLRSFAEAMRTVRHHLARVGQLTYEAEKQRWFVDAVEIYTDAVTRLVEDLSVASPSSRGLGEFARFAAEYAASDAFGHHRDRAKRVKAALASIRYTMRIHGLRVDILPSDEEADYGAEIEAAFARFRQGAVEAYSFPSGAKESLDKVELMVLDEVARMHPEAFTALDAFYREHQDFLHQPIMTFDREIQFYLAVLDYTERLQEAGLHFCYPRLSRDAKEIYIAGSFDLALADKLVGEDKAVVRNDLHISGAERVVVVTGPNQGGKTTFARAVGQAHYLTSLGCPVPGRRARLVLCDRIFTHFEKGEEIADLSGRLKDDLVRIRAILDHATPRSLVIVNEIFSSTSLRDAIALSEKIAEQMIARDLLCVWVTFVDELASLGDQTVSMVSAISTERPEERTYRIVRRPSDGLAYAMSVARKYRLTRELIDERLPP